MLVGQKWSGQIRICRFGHGLRRPSEEAPEKGCWTSIISQFTYTMRNFIWFLRRSAPCCKSRMEHSHEQFKQQISFAQYLFVALWRLSEACSVKQLKWIVGSLHPATFFLWAPALKRPKWELRRGSVSLTITNLKTAGRDNAGGADGCRAFLWFSAFFTW